MPKKVCALGGVLQGKINASPPIILGTSKKLKRIKIFFSCLPSTGLQQRQVLRQSKYWIGGANCVRVNHSFFDSGAGAFFPHPRKARDGGEKTRNPLKGQDQLTGLASAGAKNTAGKNAEQNRTKPVGKQMKNSKKKKKSE